MLGYHRASTAGAFGQSSTIQPASNQRPEMHGLVGYIIIGGCLCAAALAAVLFIRDVKSSQRAAEKRRRLASRLVGK